VLLGKFSEAVGKVAALSLGAGFPTAAAKAGVIAPTSCTIPKGPIQSSQSTHRPQTSTLLARR